MVRAVRPWSAMARAALALFEATGDGAYLARARAWAAEADRHHWDDGRGGYFLSADDAERLIVRTKTAGDNATPSGNGTMLGVLARLWHLTGEAAYRDRADALVAWPGASMAVLPLSRTATEAPGAAPVKSPADACSAPPARPPRPPRRRR
jgi:uncharacterized protein YyaL (SSP411 family)